MGGCTPPPLRSFFDFRLRSLRYEKDFLPVLSKLSQASMVKIFHFQMSVRWFPWHPKSDVVVLLGGKNGINVELKS